MAGLPYMNHTKFYSTVWFSDNSSVQCILCEIPKITMLFLGMRNKSWRGSYFYIYYSFNFDWGWMMLWSKGKCMYLSSELPGMNLLQSRRSHNAGKDKTLSEKCKVAYPFHGCAKICHYGPIQNTWYCKLELCTICQ